MCGVRWVRLGQTGLRSRLAGLAGASARERARPGCGGRSGEEGVVGLGWLDGFGPRQVRRLVSI